MEFRFSKPALRYVWLAGCAYAVLLLLVGITRWFLQVDLDQTTLLGYGAGAALVLVFSRGLYYRSIVSGLVLLAMAVGPATGGAVRWIAGNTDSVQFASAIVEGIVALAGLAFGAVILRTVYDLWSGEVPRKSRHNTSL